jgi:hypothetical protein
MRSFGSRENVLWSGRATVFGNRSGIAETLLFATVLAQLRRRSHARQLGLDSPRLDSHSPGESRQARDLCPSHSEIFFRESGINLRSYG